MKYPESPGLLALAVFLFMISPVMTGQDGVNSYITSRVADKVWAIVENNTVNIYLVEGKDSALIIDTGYGTGDLKAYVKTLTKLPLICVNTHGHGDHAGNDHQFARIYAHPEDFAMISAGFKKEVPKKSTMSRAVDSEDPGDRPEAMLNTASPQLIPVKDGFVFDLGSRKLEVIEVPGHTHGSICLLDAENKILFAGDNTNGIVWLFLKDCYPLEVYLRSLQKVERRLDDFDINMPGHNTPLEKTFISDQISCVKSILDGTCVPVPYNYSAFTAGAMLCKYRNAEVAYDPNNLFEKKQDN